MNADRRRSIDAGISLLAEVGFARPKTPMPIPTFKQFDSAQLPDMPVMRQRESSPVTIGEVDRDGVLDASDELEDLTQLSLKRLREMLVREVVTGEDEKQTKLTLAAAVLVVQTQVKVDEGRLKKRKLDMLPKLLEIIAQEDARRQLTA